MTTYYRPLTSRNPRVSRERALYEFYPTPPEATLALLSVERFHGDIWEPACGKGHIERVLAANGHRITATDLVNWGYGTPRVDFLKQERARGKHIITNPPYGQGLADAFVEHALALTAKTGGAVAMLLNLASLANPRRHAFWQRFTPSVVYVLDDLICTPYGDPPRNRTGRQRYMWAVWHKGWTHGGPTVLRFLSTAPFRTYQPTPTPAARRDDRHRA